MHDEVNHQDRQRRHALTVCILLEALDQAVADGWSPACPSGVQRHGFWEWESC